MNTGKWDMRYMDVPPALESLDMVISFFEDALVGAGATPRAIAQTNVAVDEIFSNIARYSGATAARVGCALREKRIFLRFIDNGKPYDPTAQPDPDTSLSAEERQIGGLGIFMVKRTMEDLYYEYENGYNVLSLEKSW